MHDKNIRNEQLTPEKAFNILQDGNNRFVKNLLQNRDILKQINSTRDGQYPFATILSCMDSRTSAELIFDQGLGEIFSIRIAGNILNEDIIGSMEFASKIVGTKIIIVLGHTKCGAIIGACNDVEIGKFSHLLNKIKPAIALETDTLEQRDGENLKFVYNVTVKNVEHVIREIMAQSSIIKELVDEKKIMIIGGVYDVETGIVKFFQ